MSKKIFCTRAEIRRDIANRLNGLSENEMVEWYNQANKDAGLPLNKWAEIVMDTMGGLIKIWVFIKHAYEIPITHKRFSITIEYKTDKNGKSTVFFDNCIDPSVQRLTRSIWLSFCRELAEFKKETREVKKIEYCVLED